MSNQPLVAPVAPASGREGSMRRSSSVGLVVRVAALAALLLACIACILLSTGKVASETIGVDPVALEEPTFGDTKLTPFPSHMQPSTHDLIQIMEGHGHQDVAADQGELFAGGAGGDIQRSHVGLSSREGGRAVSMPVSKSVAKQDADDLWDAAVRASKMRFSKHGGISHHVVHNKLKSGRTGVDGTGSESADTHHGKDRKPVEKATQLKHAAFKPEPQESSLHTIEQAGVVAKSVVTKGPTTSEQQLKQQQHKREAAGHPDAVKAVQDKYFQHHMSMDDALAKVAEIRAKHDALKKARVEKAKQALEEKKAMERAADDAARAKAAAEEKQAKAMQERAAAAARKAADEERKARQDEKLAKQELSAKHAEERKIQSERQQLKLGTSRPARVAKTSVSSSASAPGAVSEGDDLAKSLTSWTPADEQRAEHLAKEFALRSQQAHARAVDAHQGNEAAQTSGAGDIAPLYPTGFIPSQQQHDDARRPDALPEMIEGDHAARQAHEGNTPLSEYAQSLKREAKMHSDEDHEELERDALQHFKSQLYRVDHEQAEKDREVRSGERLVDELTARAEVARFMQKVDMSGVRMASSLENAISGDSAHFDSFVEDKWMPECGSSKLLIAPVAKQVIAIRNELGTKNASAWLDVEDAARRADNARAALHSAEAALVAVLENKDRTQAVALLERLRKERRQRRAERMADKIHAEEQEENADKVSLLKQQKAALNVLSHAEEAEALSGDARRVQLNKAAEEAQKAVRNEDGHEGDRNMASYVHGFESKLLATAERPWSLSAQEGVQSLLGDINSKILGIEHEEQTRNKGLKSLESRVSQRIGKLSEVDAADRALKREITRENDAVTLLRSDADVAEHALAQATRAYQENLAQDEADLRAARQVMRRLQALMTVCSNGVRLQTNLAAPIVTPWVTSPSSSTLASSPMRHSNAGDKYPAPTHKSAASDKAAAEKKAQLAHLKRQEVQVQADASSQVQRLQNELRNLRPLAIAQSSAEHLTSRSKTQLASASVAQAQARKTLAGGKHVYIRDMPPRPHTSQDPSGRSENRLVEQEIESADRDERSLESSEEQRLSAVAGMITSDAHEGSR